MVGSETYGRDLRRSSEGNEQIIHNGTSGTSAIVRVDLPVLAAIFLTNSIKLVSGAFRFSFTNGSTFGFTTLTSTNLGLPLTNWMAQAP